MDPNENRKTDPNLNRLRLDSILTFLQTLTFFTLTFLRTLTFLQTLTFFWTLYRHQLFHGRYFFTGLNFFMDPNKNPKTVPKTDPNPNRLRVDSTLTFLQTLTF